VTTPATPARDYREELRAERHREEEAHAARVARAAAAGLTPAEFARRATADAYELRAAAIEAGHREADGMRAVWFDLYACAERRDWNQDRADACLRRAGSLGLLRHDRRVSEQHGSPTFTVDRLQGGPCPTCGHPLSRVMPRRRDPADDQPDLFTTAAEPDDDDQERDGPCYRCAPDPHAEEDTRALLEEVGRAWAAYRERPSQKANGKYDEGGHHPYMRCAFDGFGYRPEGDTDRRPFDPPDGPRVYSHRDRDRRERIALARLIAGGFVAMVDEPDRRAKCLRATFGITDKGARLIGLDLSGLPEPVQGRFRTHQPRRRADTSQERRAMAEGMTARLREDRETPPTPADGECQRCAPDHWRPCPHAFRCPACGANPWAACRRPSGHKAQELHTSRVALARAHWTPEQAAAEAAYEAGEQPEPVPPIRAWADALADPCPCGHTRGTHADGSGQCLAFPGPEPRDTCPCRAFAGEATDAPPTLAAAALAQHGPDALDDDEPAALDLFTPTPAALREPPSAPPTPVAPPPAQDAAALTLF
jgi:hypothetical protein